MNYRLFVIAVLLIIVSCAENRNEENRAYYRAQVQRRIEAIMTDSTNRELPVIHEEVEKIILVSKDTENPQAAFELARTLFDSLCQTYGLSRADFPDIGPGMTADEIELRLRENELAFFDRLVMKQKPGSAQLFTAH